MYILFDIDGTLINTGGAGRAALELALLREFDVEDPEKVPVMGRTDRGIIGSLFEAHDIEFSDRNWERYLATYLDVLPGTLPTKQGRVLDCVQEVLTQLQHSDGVELGLLTGNLAEGAKIKLGYYNVYHFFAGGCGGFGDHSTDRDDVAQAAWESVQGQCPSARPEDIWVVGDTPLDVKCARAIGAKCVALTTGTYSREELAPCNADLLLDSLGDPAFIPAVTGS